MISERPVTISPDSGPALEAAIALPAGAGLGVVVCHPHPRYGGNMDSPVVVTAAAACVARGLATLRFNFRGVGGSAGAWDEGRGEREDVRAALAYLRARLGSPARAALAGYSFGAVMAAAVAAAGEPLAGLALIAPPLATVRLPLPGCAAIDGPTLVVAGSHDTHCPGEALSTLAATLPGATVVMIDGSDHFFFAGLDALEAALAGWAGKVES
jgi:alpha/beta superfamily hydrolase